jgi:hypothetical protein
MLFDSQNMANGLVYVEAHSLTFKDREGTPIQQYNKFVLHFVLKMIDIANLETHQVGDSIGVRPPSPLYTCALSTQSEHLTEVRFGLQGGLDDLYGPTGSSTNLIFLFHKGGARECL